MTTPKFELKKIAKAAGHGGLSTLAFGVSHLLFSKIPEGWKSGLKLSGLAFALFALATTISTQSENDLVKSAVAGVQTYTGIKFLNGLTSIAPAVSGLEGAIPEGMKKFISMIAPNLGEASPDTYANELAIYGTESEMIPADDAPYTMVSGSEDLVLPAINGSEEEEFGGVYGYADLEIG